MRSKYLLTSTSFHFNNIYPVLYQRFHINDGWYIGVEFFFLISGIFLAHKSRTQREKGQHISAIKYTVKRLKKLYPEYLAALAITSGILVYRKTGAEKQRILMTALGEAFMLQLC